MTQELQDWMIQNEYYELDQFRGSMSQAKAQDPAVYERFQFMKHFGGLRSVASRCDGRHCRHEPWRVWSGESHSERPRQTA